MNSFFQKAMPWVGGFCLGVMSHVFLRPRLPPALSSPANPAIASTPVLEKIPHAAVARDTSAFPNHPGAGEFSKEQFPGLIREVMLKKTPEKRLIALRELARRTPVKDLGSLIKGLYQAADQGDVDYGTGGDDLAHYSAIHSLASIIMEIRPTEVLQSLLEQEDELVTQCFGQWARMDLTAAKSWFDTNLLEGDNKLAKNAARALSMAWLESDPAGALNWAGELPKAVGKDALRDLTAYVGRRDAGLMASYITLHPEKFEWDRFIGQFSGNWAGKDAAAAFQWASKLPDHLKNAGLPAIVKTWQEKDWPAAHQAVQNLPASLAPSAALGLASACPLADVAPYASMLQTQAASKARDQAAGSFAGRWTSLDSLAASEWVSSLPKGDPFQQAAVQGLANELQKSDPAAGATWATAIEDGAQRRRLLEDQLTRWAETEADAVTAWLQTAPLPVSDKEELASRVQINLAPR